MSLEHSPARDGVRLLRRKQVLALLVVSDTTLWRWVAAGAFPRPVRIGPNSRAELGAEVDEFIRRRAEERGAG